MSKLTTCCEIHYSSKNKKSQTTTIFMLASLMTLMCWMSQISRLPIANVFHCQPIVIVTYNKEKRSSCMPGVHSMPNLEILAYYLTIRGLDILPWVASVSPLYRVSYSIPLGLIEIKMTF